MRTTSFNVKLFSLIAALTLSVGPALAQQTQTEPAEQQQNQAAVSKELAEEIAIRHVPGRVADSELQTQDDGQEVWKVELEAADGEDYEVVIDSNSGRVLEVSS